MTILVLLAFIGGWFLGKWSESIKREPTGHGCLMHDGKPTMIRCNCGNYKTCAHRVCPAFYTEVENLR